MPLWIKIFYEARNEPLVSSAVSSGRLVGWQEMHNHSYSMVTGILGLAIWGSSQQGVSIPQECMTQGGETAPKKEATVLSELSELTL